MIWVGPGAKIVDDDDEASHFGGYADKSLPSQPCKVVPGLWQRYNAWLILIGPAGRLLFSAHGIL